MKKGIVALSTGIILTITSLTACGLAPQVNAMAPEDDPNGLYDYTLETLIDELHKENTTDKEFEDLGYSADYRGYTYAYGEEGLSKIGYSYRDVTRDGIPELFIGDIGTGAVYDIYTIVNKQPAHVASGGEFERYYVYDTGWIAYEASSSPTSSMLSVYMLGSNSADLAYSYSYMYDEYKDAQNPWFTSDDGKNWAPISEKEYNEAMALSERHRAIDFKPLSELVENN